MSSPREPVRGLLHDDAGPERFELRRHDASADLAGFVEFYWVTRWRLPAGQPYRQKVLSHPCVNAVVDPTGRSGVFGIVTGRFERELAGEGRAFGIKFWPGAFHAFLRRPVAALTDRCAPFQAVFGAAGRAYVAAVEAAGDDEALVGLAERLLRGRACEVDGAAARARRIVERVASDREITRVEHLAMREGMSPRSLQRLFHRCIGASPKWVVQRYRLHEAVELIEEGADVDLAALALRLGYFDQAHFTRDFRRLVGRPPAAYRRTAASRGDEQS